MKVDLIHVDMPLAQVVESKEFPNANRFQNREIQTWVKQMAKKYSKLPDYQNTDENWYEFQYKKFTRVTIPAGEWVVCQVEFLNDKI